MVGLSLTAEGPKVGIGYRLPDYGIVTVPMRLSLPKNALLTQPWQYQQVYSQGQRLWGKGFSLIFLDNDQGQDRLGISVSGQKRAVRRNRIKRLIKEYYRHNRTFPSLVANKAVDCHTGVDLVIATNQKFPPLRLADMHAILNRHNGGGGCKGVSRIVPASVY